MSYIDTEGLGMQVINPSKPGAPYRVRSSWPVQSMVAVQPHPAVLWAVLATVLSQ
jgi:hypothetical protein